MRISAACLLSVGAALFCALGVISKAFAVDGVVEINQACAVNTGCVSGDSAGFPVSISSPGSYRLTSNLDLAGAGTSVDAINISVTDVTVDLNGFELVGTCDSSTLPCTPFSGGDGVFSNSKRITVKNGTIRNMTRNGIVLGPQARVENVRVLANANAGIQLTGTSPHGSIIRLNHIADNGAHGITLGLGGILIEKNSCVNNFGTGIFLGGGNGLVADNVLTDNSSDGIRAPNNGNNVFRGNLITNNGGEGIDTIGSPAKTGNLVIGNTITQNTGVGVAFSSTDNGYTENVIRGNGGGTVSSGTEIGTNLCNSNTTCP